MNGHEIYAVGSMRLDNFEEFIDRDILQSFIEQTNRIIHRHRTDHRRGRVKQPTPESLGFAETAEIHDRLGFQLNCLKRFGQLQVEIAAVLGNTQVHINFCPQASADPFRVNFRMVFVSRNHNLTGCHQFPQTLRVHFFLGSDSLHLRCNDSLFRRIHLC